MNNNNTCKSNFMREKQVWLVKLLLFNLKGIQASGVYISMIKGGNRDLIEYLIDTLDPFNFFSFNL